MVEISKLPKSRWKEYRDLCLEALKTEPAAFGSSYEEEKNLSESEWKGRLENVLFAMHNDKPVGMIVFVFMKQHKLKHVANIYATFVLKKWRGKGIGEQLMDSALHFIKKNKCIIKINLNVNPKQKEALKVYQKFGFKHVGTLKKDLCVKSKFYDEWIMETFIR